MSAKDGGGGETLRDDEIITRRRFGRSALATLVAGLGLGACRSGASGRGGPSGAAHDFDSDDDGSGGRSDDDSGSGSGGGSRRGSDRASDDP
jgi:hypothetical protein